MSFQNPQKTNLEICFQQPHPLLVRNASYILGQISFSDGTLHDTSANLRNSLQRGLTPLPDSEKIVWCRNHLALQIVFLEAAAPQKGGECYKHYSSGLCQKASSSELNIWIINIHPWHWWLWLKVLLLFWSDQECDQDMRIKGYPTARITLFVWLDEGMEAHLVIQNNTQSWPKKTFGRVFQH